MIAGCIHVVDTYVTRDVSAVSWWPLLVHVANTRVSSYGELCMCVVSVYVYEHCVIPKGSAMNEL